MLYQNEEEITTLHLSLLEILVQELALMIGQDSMLEHWRGIHLAMYVLPFVGLFVSLVKLVGLH